MALDIKTLKRVFKNGKTELSDPDISMTPDDVMSFYSNTYPALTTSTVQGPKIEGDTAVYEFRTTVGTKG
jgi:PRTRC genetic system protein C